MPATARTPSRPAFSASFFISVHPRSSAVNKALTPDQYCRQKAAQSGSSFYYSFRFLPPERRQAITALYAFCREVDDAVDEPGDAAVARARIAWWRGEVARLYAGSPSHPVTQSLLAATGRYHLKQADLLEIIDGMEMDLDHARYERFEDLTLYCHRVAGVVGLLAARIFGFRNPRTLEYAGKLGLAFQLTNIIRDVGEDVRLNRIYLPLEDLLRFEVPAADILDAKYSESFRRLMAFQADRAEAIYRQAMALLPEEDRRSQRPGLMMAGIYRTLLAEIRRDGFQVLSQRTALTPVRKLWIAWRTWMNA